MLRLTRAQRMPHACLVALAVIAILDPVAGAPSANLRADLPFTSERDRQRLLTAAQEALDRYAEWFGPCPVSSLTLVASGASRERSQAAGHVVVDVPWLAGPATMDLESQAAYGVALHWWPRLLESTDTAPIVHGLAWYLQSRVVEPLFNRNFHVPGHSADGVRVFGGIVPWVFGSLPLDRWSGGLGRLEFLRPEPTAWPRPARRLPSSVDRAARQGAMAFATLERYVGWPALQGAIRELARASGQRSLPRADVYATIARALGQDLSWFVTAAFERPADFSYLVHSLSTEQLPAPCPAERCYRTSVVVARRGGDVFTGSSVPPDDGFESGDAMTLRVSFVDGGTAAARWDGRAATRAFTFESAAPPAFAALDPDRVLLLDDDYLDNLAFAESPPGPPVEKWVAYWMVWLQGAILDYGSLF